MFRISTAQMDCLSSENIMPVRSTPNTTRLPKLPKWDEETTVKFVQLYKQHESLWNSSLPEYKDKFRRYIACKSISDQMGLPEFGPNEVPRKIKILRSTYYQEILKIDKARLNGDENAYVPALRWFSIMDDVLRDLPHKRQSFPTADLFTVENTMNETGNSQNIIPPFIVDPLVANNIIVKTEKSDEGNIEIHEIVHQENLVPLSETEPLARSPRTVRNERRAMKRRAFRKKQLSRIKRREGLEDEFLIFGKHVAAQLRRLEEEECVAAQEQIQSVLSQARLRTIQRYNPSNQYTEENYIPSWVCNN